MNAGGQRDYLIEVCVEGLSQALRAEARGADRIELCSNLDKDGLTPTAGVIQMVKERLSIPIRVMIRPREGDFNYSQVEIEQMKQSIEVCRQLRVDGVVFGVTDARNKLNVSVIEELVQCAAPLKVTIHKVIDAIHDSLEGLESLMSINGINAILTSGGKPICTQGATTIKSLIAIAGEFPEVIVCGKVTRENIAMVHQTFKARAYHGKLIVGALDAVSES